MDIEVVDSTNQAFEYIENFFKGAFPPRFKVSFQDNEIADAMVFSKPEKRIIICDRIITFFPTTKMVNIRFNVFFRNLNKEETPVIVDTLLTLGITERNQIEIDKNSIKLNSMRFAFRFHPNSI